MSAAPTHAPRGAWAGPLGAALVFALALAVHAGSLLAGFVWDDHALIEANPAIASLHDAPRLFRTHAFGGAEPAGERVIEYYRPVWTLSLAVDRAVWGLKPSGYHLTNVLLHAIVSVLVLLLARAWIADALAALAAGLLFAAHPVHVEAVAWISARNELLAAMFGLLSLLFLDACRVRPRALEAAGCLGAGALALLSKELAVTLPMLAALTALARPKRRAVGLVLGLLLVVAGYLALRARVVGALDLSAPLADRLLTAPVLVAQALRLLIVPVGLSLYHVVPIVKSAWSPEFLVSLPVLAAWGAAFAFGRRRHPLLAIGLLWIPVALIPVSGLAGFPKPALFAERYLYMASVGVALIAAAVVALARSRAATVAAFAVVAGFAALSVARTALWRDDLTLMARVTRDAPGEPSGFTNLGAALERVGRIEEARDAYANAARLSPADPQAHANLGIALGKLGVDGGARREFEAAIALRPRDAGLHANLGWLAARNRRWGDAAAAYRAAIGLDSGAAGAHAGLARALQNLGDLAGAEREYRATLALVPDDSRTMRELGVMYRKSGRLDDAIRELSAAAARHPQSAETRLELGVAFGTAGRFAEAEAALRAALALRPRWAEAQFDLGAVLAAQGKAVEARAALAAARDIAEPGSDLSKRIEAALAGLPAR